MSGDLRRFERQVFINCPFDAGYRPLLQALLFTLLDAGMEPRIALESADSGQTRVQKLYQLIRDCGLSIHDISRMEPLAAGELPRFNLPFELGLDLGCRPRRLVQEVRNWLRVVTRADLRGPAEIWKRYNDFLLYLTRALRERGFDEENLRALELVEYMDLARGWGRRR